MVLTRKQQVLRAVAEITREQGYPPSYRDLGQSVGIAHSAVYSVVEALRTDGLVSQRQARRSRAITLTDAGWEAALT